MKILYATSEAVPFCKTGGLADVAGSLPPALAAEGAEIAVVLPLYRRIKERFGDQLYFECYDYVDLAWRHSYCGLFSLQKDGVTWYFLDNEQYFDRSELYGYMDDGERFAFFSRAVVRMLGHLKFWPEVIHCNDWQTALVPIYLKDDGVREERFRTVRTVLTIHNIEYQGRYNPYILGDLFGLDSGWAKDGTLLMDGDVNLLKGAILCADAVTAVSPTYANELKMAYFAHRLEGIISKCEYKLSGVEIGLDKLIKYSTRSSSHNSYMYGNAFEAFIGAIYLDQGYERCKQFMEQRIINRYIDLDKISRKEVNFKSKLIEWSQKSKLEVSFELIEQFLDQDSNPVFQTEVRIEGLPAGTGTGYSKKESQQNAAQMAIKKVKDPTFMATVNETKMQQSAMAAEPEPEMDADSDIELLNDNILEENEFDNEITAEPIVKSIQSKSPCDVPESPDRDLH